MSTQYYDERSAKYADAVANNKPLQVLVKLIIAGALGCVIYNSAQAIMLLKELSEHKKEVVRHDTAKNSTANINLVRQKFMPHGKQH